MSKTAGDNLLSRLTSRGVLFGVAALLGAIWLFNTMGRDSLPSAPPKQAANPPAAAPAVPATATGDVPVRTTSAAAAPAFSAEQKTAIEGIVKDYLLRNPELMLDVQRALEERMEQQQAERMQRGITENAKLLFRSPTSPVAGNAEGDVTVVEFFDYNCGYCKRALPDLAELIEKDSKVRIVLKEMPILSKGSFEVAKLALAAGLQGKYWEFHSAMLETQGQLNETVGLRVAERLGLDVERLKKDAESSEGRKELEETQGLARRLGIQGTPHFIVGNRVVPGAPEGLVDVLAEQIDAVRKDGSCEKIC